MIDQQPVDSASQAVGPVGRGKLLLIRAARLIRAYPIHTIVVGLIVLAIGILVVGLLHRTPSFDWNRAPATLVEIPGAKVGDPNKGEATDLLNQVTALAAGVEGSASEVAVEGRESPPIALAVTGSQNSLNGVQIGIARAMGADREPNPWSNKDQSDPAASTYKKDDFQLHGVRVDSVTSKSRQGLAQTWLMARPKPDLLLLVRCVDNPDDDALAVLRQMMQRAEN